MTDWRSMLAGWDEQQTGYLPRREERFAVITRTLGDVLGDEFTVLDLGCGPGSLSVRILETYPRARAVAVDSDPVLLALGQRALGDLGGRLRWVDADLREPDWADRLGTAAIDAAVSTTALHWLEPGVLIDVYRRVGELIQPGGVVLNGDNMPYARREPAIQRLADLTTDRATEDAFLRRGVADWQQWWERAERSGELDAEFAERERRNRAADERWGERKGQWLTSLETHVLGLSEAGFTETGTIWQLFDDRVLLGVKGTDAAPTASGTDPEGRAAS
jgi:trans-aconitate methyltransferase